MSADAAVAAHANWDNGVLANLGDINKPFNGFYHPMSGQQPGDELYNSNKELEFQIQIGSKQFPEYPIKSMAESFAQLRKLWGFSIVPWEALTLLAHSTPSSITY